MRAAKRWAGVSRSRVGRGRVLSLSWMSFEVVFGVAGQVVPFSNGYPPKPWRHAL